MVRVEAARTLPKIVLADQPPYCRVTGNQALDKIGARIVGVDIEAMLRCNSPCRDQRHGTTRLAVEQSVHDVRLEFTQRGHGHPLAGLRPWRPRPAAPRARVYRCPTRSVPARRRTDAAPRDTSSTPHRIPARHACR